MLYCVGLLVPRLGATGNAGPPFVPFIPSRLLALFLCASSTSYTVCAAVPQCRSAALGKGAVHHVLPGACFKGVGMPMKAEPDDSGRISPLSDFVPRDSAAPDNGASGMDLERDMRRVAAWHQSKLHNIILSEARKAQVSREDHRLMLKQLVSAAYHRDPQRKENIERWKRIMLAVEMEYIGANALFSLAPDPYQQVLSKLSSMMIWGGGKRHWTYSYCTEEFARRRSCHTEVLQQLKQSGKYFLNG
ncbi:uncharacterized protein Tco025E_09675 [Trypanosoma conorhini]|uniref:Uncharacterized protein n=1 Tax=Trypanosoma conorhini TaxID=83891 RepID=A0A3R7KL75_9TRYP|nr:uncharacterized protein Tco025E_09675 [Trypanosoma conorhini]RNE96661.1 hypothetical protein Tco025E_09675 [Trypanosoma conorhini]